MALGINVGSVHVAISPDFTKFAPTMEEGVNKTIPPIADKASQQFTKPFSKSGKEAADLFTKGLGSTAATSAEMGAKAGSEFAASFRVRSEEAVSGFSALGGKAGGQFSAKFTDTAAKNIGGEAATGLKAKTSLALGDAMSAAGVVSGGKYSAKFSEEGAKVDSNFGTRLSGALKGHVESAGHEAGGIFSNIFGTAIGAGGGAAALLGIAGIGASVEGVKQANEMREAQDQLDIAFKNTGLDIDKYRSQISALQVQGEKYGQTNADTDASLTKLVTATGSMQTAQSALSTAYDIAAFKHISVSDAVSNLTKAYAGNARGLKDLGLLVPPAVTAANVQKATVADLATKYGNLSDKFTNTGPQQKLITATDGVTAAHNRLLTAQLALTSAQDALKKKGGDTIANQDKLTIAQNNLSIATNQYKLAQDGVSKAQGAALPGMINVNAVTAEARRLHLSYRDTLKLVTEAENGNSAAQKKLGEDVTGTAAMTERYNNILDQMNGKLKGQGAAAAETLSGKMSALKATVKDLLAQWGEILLPIIKDVVSGLLDFSRSAEGVSSWISGHMDLVKALAVAFGAIGLAVIISVVPAFYTWASANIALAATWIALNAASGGILLAIGAIAFGVYELVTHWSTAWAAIKKVAEDFWHWIKDAAMDVYHFLQGWGGLILLAVFGPVLGGLMLLALHWRQVYADVKQWSSDFVNGLMNDFVNPIDRFFTVLLPGAFFAAWHGFDNYFVQPVKRGAEDFVNFFTVTVWGGLDRFFTVLLPGAFVYAWQKFDGYFVQPIKSAGLGLAHWFTNDFINPIHDLLYNTIPNAFDHAVSAVKSAWDKVAQAAADPIKWVVQYVYQGGIRTAWDAVAGVFGAPNMPDASGVISALSNVAKFATGGIVPGGWGGGDSQIVMAEPGERILSLDQVLRLGGHSAIDNLVGQSQTSFKNGMAYAQGGLTNPNLPDPLGKGSAGSLFNPLPAGGPNLQEPGIINTAPLLHAVRGGVADLFSAAVSPLEGLADRALGTGAGFKGLLDKGVHTAITDLLNWIRGDDSKHASSVPSPSGISGNVKSWVEQGMKIAGVSGSAWENGLLTIAQNESGGNPNVVNTTDSNWLAGHPSAGLMQFIKSTFDAYAMPGHTDWMNPIDQVVADAWAHGYIKSRYGDITAVPGVSAVAHHMKYVGYDSGGMWPSGTLGLNMTGRDEGVLTPNAVDRIGGAPAVSALNSGGGLGGVQVHVYIGDEEIHDHIDVRVAHALDGVAQALNGGLKT